MTRCGRLPHCPVQGEMMSTCLRACETSRHKWVHQPRARSPKSPTFLVTTVKSSPTLGMLDKASASGAAERISGFHGAWLPHFCRVRRFAALVRVRFLRQRFEPSGLLPRRPPGESCNHWQHLIVYANFSRPTIHFIARHRFNNNAFDTTLTLLSAIAAPAIMGLSKPNAAAGTPTTL